MDRLEELMGKYHIGERAEAIKSLVVTIGDGSGSHKIFMFKIEGKVQLPHCCFWINSEYISDNYTLETLTEYLKNAIRKGEIVRFGSEGEDIRDFSKL